MSRVRYGTTSHSLLRVASAAPCPLAELVRRTERRGYPLGSPGSVASAPADLERRGLLRCDMPASERGRGRSVALFAITSAGEDALNALETP